MAEETQNPEVVETKPEHSKVEEEKKVEVEEEKKVEEEPEKEKEPLISQTASFKEESNVVANLIDPEKKALDELKELIIAALANNEFTRPPPPPPVKEDEKKEDEKKEEEKKEEEKKEEEKKEDEKKQDEKKEEEKKEEAVVEKSEEPTATPAKEEEPTSEISPPEKKTEKSEEPTSEVSAPEEKKAEVVEKPEEKKPTSEIPPPEENKAAVVEDDAATKTVVAIEETNVPVPASVDPSSAPEEEKACDDQPNPPAEEIFIWGVPLLGGDKTDTLLLKFLRARDFKVKDALTMIKNSVIWRKEFGIEALLDEDLGLPELEKVVFMHGEDKEGHPVCYNVYGEFQEKELYHKAFGDEEKRKNFLRWRVRVLEKGIREKLDFSPEGVCTMVQVTDLKNSPGPGKTELRQATNQALHLLQDNYPEFAAKQIFINVPWWYLAFNRMIAPFFTQRSKSKFVFAGPSKSAETLFKYIAPEQVPVQYGGLSMDTDTEFSTSDAVTEVSIKPASKHTVEIPVTQGTVFVWELRVLRWDVNYGAEFVSDAEGGYTVIVQKMRKFVSTDEAVARNSFKIGEPGKVVLTVDNATHKKKKLLYRYKIKSSTD